MGATPTRNPLPVPSPILQPPSIFSPILSPLLASIAAALGGTNTGAVVASTFSFPISLIYMGY